LELFRVWAIEARTQRWRIFTPEESFTLYRNPKLVDKISHALRTQARARIAVKRAALVAIGDT
jgi:hypothetical protein